MSEPIPIPKVEPKVDGNSLENADNSTLLAEIAKLRTENANRRVKSAEVAKENEDINLKYSELMSKINEETDAKKLEAEMQLKKDGEFEALLKSKENDFLSMAETNEKLTAQNLALLEFQNEVIETKLELIQDDELREILKETKNIKLINKTLEMQTNTQKNSIGANDSGKTPKDYTNFNLDDWNNLATTDPAGFQSLMEKEEYQKAFMKIRN